MICPHCHKEIEPKRYRLHWLNGKIEEVEGHDIADAFSKAGYGGGALGALDWYEEIKEAKP